MASETVFYNNINMNGIGTITATTGFSGPGTNLTGTASGLAAGGLTGSPNITVGTVSATSAYFNGTVGIGNITPSYTLDITGGVRATQDVIAYSDVRVKKDIEKIDNALEKISQISGYTFNRKDCDSKRQAGVLAQEVQKVLPEVVYEDNNGMYSVAYGNLVALLIEAIKEEKAKREALEKRIKILEDSLF